MRRHGPGHGDLARHRPPRRRYRPCRAPHYDTLPNAAQSFYDNVIVAGGPEPVRAYIDELLPDVMEGRIDPGQVFDRTVGLEGVLDGYAAMNAREP